MLTNQGGTGTQALPPRTDLPPIAKQIPDKPPEDFPKFDPAKPDQTDFQLQQAVAWSRRWRRRKAPPLTDLGGGGCPLCRPAAVHRPVVGLAGLGRFWGAVLLSLGRSRRVASAGAVRASGPDRRTPRSRLRSRTAVHGAGRGQGPCRSRQRKPHTGTTRPGDAGPVAGP